VKEKLREVANELAELMGLEPMPEKHWGEEKLKTYVKKAGKLLKEEDKISSSCAKLFKELGIVTEACEDKDEEDEEEPIKKNRKHKEEEDEEEDEEDDEEEDEEE